MNHANYKKWLQKLIPNLESKSVIVVDSASYHNVQVIRNPTSNARKDEMLFWLDKHSSDMTKVESCAISEKRINRNMSPFQLNVCSQSMGTQ
jgi:predicted O-methyltransferase YrrM